MEQKQNRFALRQPGLARRIKPWLSRAAWLRQKALRRAVAFYKRQMWLRRRDKWLRRNKRPFWKRKSFKRLRAEQNIIGSLFLVSKKYSGSAQMVARKRSSKKILYRRYYRSNTVKRDFKTRLVLRHYWKFRYECYTHNKLQNFLLSVRKKSRRLLYFFCKFELVLHRYVKWWGIIPSYCDDKLSKFFVSHGYIYVNFVTQINPVYEVKPGDCVFSVAPMQALTEWFIQPRYVTLYGHVKYFPGRKEFVKPFKRVTAPLNIDFYRGWRERRHLIRETWLQDRWFHPDRLYLKLRSLLQVSTWAPLGLIHYSLLLETSYKIKVVIQIIAYDWFTIAFGAVRAYNDLNTILINKFLSFSYY